MGSVRRFVAAVALATAGAGLVLASALPAGASTQTGHDPKLKPATRSANPAVQARPKVWLKTWGNAPSYRAGNVRVGTLNGGSNYFYCQATGSPYTAHGYHNYWWALTDDDTGNKNVWVNDVYITTGSNNQPVPGLPKC